MNALTGKVTRVDGSGVYVRCDQRLPGVELGPLPAVTPIVAIGMLTTSSDGSPAHTHTIAAFDQTVAKVPEGSVVLLIEIDTDDFLVIGVVTRAVTS